MADIKGKDNYDVMPQIDGVDIVPALGTINQVLTKDSGTSYDYSWQDATGGGASPGGNNHNIQFNNSGTFGGEDTFLYDDTLNAVFIGGTPEDTMLQLGGNFESGTGSPISDTGNATLYIEVNTAGSSIEAMRTYFNRQSPGISGWITYHYDGATPNLRLTDEDDDAPYISFHTIASGTYDQPEFVSTFGARGSVGSRDPGEDEAGFAWLIGEDVTPQSLYSSYSPVMELDTEWLRIPTGTTANRPPTPENGMVRYNTTTDKFEGYENSSWKDFNTMRPTFPIWAEENSTVNVATNNYEYSFGNGAVNSTANPPGIPVGVACTLVAISISARNTQAALSSFSISITNNGSVVATGGVASGSTQNAQIKNTTQVTPDTVNFAVGDTVQFLTASAAGGLDDVRVCGWFERTS